MLKLLSASALALVVVGAASAASATTAISFSGYQTALNPGEMLFSNFDSGLPTGSTGNADLATGDAGGVTAAPAFSSTTFDTTQYLTVAGGESETFNFNAPVNEVSLYVGSLDAYNNFSFNNGGGSFAGSDMAIAGAVDSGDQAAGSSNGRLTFNFSAPVSSLTLSSSQNALEVSNIAVSAAPEPGTWMLMFAGVAMMGAMLRFGRRRQGAAFTA